MWPHMFLFRLNWKEGREYVCNKPNFYFLWTGDALKDLLLLILLCENSKNTFADIMFHHRPTLSNVYDCILMRLYLCVFQARVLTLGLGLSHTHFRLLTTCCVIKLNLPSTFFVIMMYLQYSIYKYVTFTPCKVTCTPNGHLIAKGMFFDEMRKQLQISTVWEIHMCIWRVCKCAKWFDLRDTGFYEMLAPNLNL